MKNAVRQKAQCQRFIQRTLSSSMAREGALYAARMIESQRWHQRLIDRGEIRDHDVLALLGLEFSDGTEGKVTVRELREVIAQQLRRLEQSTDIRSDVLSRNISTIGDILKLGATERAVLRLAVIASRVRNFYDLIKLGLATQWDLIRAVAKAIDHRFMRVHKALAEYETLRRSGFLENSEMYINGSNPLEVDAAVIDALMARQFDQGKFLRRLVRPGEASTLTLEDFSHLDDLEVVNRYLADSTRQKRKGVNVLLYGPPGTGKTEFVRALAPALGLDLFEVPNQDATGDPISGRRRFNAYTVCQNLLAPRRGQLLLFDEVEDVFGSGGGSSGAIFAAFGSRRMRDPDELRKSWVNETLESNAVPAVWVCNSIDAIDAAFLRRFDLVVEFRSPSRKIRRRIIDRYFDRGEISEACAAGLAEIENLPPAQVARASRVVHALKNRSMETRSRDAERIVEASMRAMGHGQTTRVAATGDHYDPAFLNTDRDLSQLTKGLVRHGGSRLCLYGPPGTGKTAFAHHLGRVLDCAVLVRRGSDLLGMYVGETEAKIARAFKQAKDERAILLFDEADGFLRDRREAQRPWEVTQVNELLTQMEVFEGIFMCSTNLASTLDPASLRRFDFKVKFDYLTRDQRQRFLVRVAPNAGAQDLREAIELVDRLTVLTPGDFANVLRQFLASGQSRTALKFANLLAAESRMKDTAPRGIGFVL